MSTLHALWVDDDWNTVGRRQQWLSDALASLNHHLRLRNHYIKWQATALAADAHVALSRPNRPDYRLALLDCEFKDQYYDWEVVVSVLQESGIPFIFCSRFLEEAKTRFEHLVQERFLVGVVDKSEEGLNTLLQLVSRFFDSPPIRLLHLSDFHFDANGTRNSEQQGAWEALGSILEAEEARWPFDVVALTGDFANNRPGRDLVAVRTHIKNLIRKTVGLSNLDRVFVIPGNHDLSWADFRQGVLSEHPWQPYLDFYQTLFSDRADLMSELGAWNPTEALFNPDCRVEDLVWARWLPSLRLRVLGLASPTERAEYQGRGVIGLKQRKRANELFSSTRIYGEVRLGMIHHNIFGVLSFDPQEDKRTVLAPGEVLQSLLGNGIQLVLCGHTHVSNVFGVWAARYHTGIQSVASVGKLATVSAGTTGGRHSSGMLPRSFNILEIGSAEGETGRRRVILKAYVYDPASQEWTIATREGYTGFELELDGN